MNKNIFSLLNGNWNIDDSYSSVLFPFLFQIINGTEISENNQLSETLVNFYNSSLKPFNAIHQPFSNNGLPGEKSVALIQVHHPIFKYDQTCGPKGTQTIMQFLENFKNDDQIVGVVMDYNTGGGQASGNSEFADYVNEFKKTKPIVSYTNGLLASAGFYMAAASSKIVINKHADYIGSIGTMFKNLNLEGILIKKGATINELYATKSIKKNKMGRDLKAENLDAVITEFIDPLSDQFESDMKEYRPQLKKEVFEGNVFTPKKAIELGLGDQLGTLQDAINLVFDLAEDKNKSNINNNKMNTENLTQLLAVLGVENLASTDEGVFLNEAQLNTIEQNVTDQATAVTDAQAAQQTAEDNLQTANDSDTAVTAAIQTALTEAEVEGVTEMTNEEGIEALSALIVEYGGNDGASTTTVAANANQESVNDNLVGGIDISAAMNN